MSDCAGSWQEQLIIKIWIWCILPPPCQNASKAKGRISSSRICMQCRERLFLQLSLCHDRLYDHEQGSSYCPLPNLQLQSLVSCMMKWIITTAAWKNIIWPTPSYSPKGTELWSLLKIDCAFNKQCSFRLSGHPAEKLEGYKRSIEIN